MSDMKRLEELKPIADEMLAGLHADERMKRRVREAALAKAPRRRPARVLVPAVCCAALAVACVGVLKSANVRAPGIARIDTLTAGSEDEAAPEGGVRLAGVLGAGASVRVAPQQEGTLFAGGEGDMPLVALDGGVYRMLSEPSPVSEALRGEAVGAIASFTEEPSLASEEALGAGLSNVAAEGSTIYAVAGLDSQTAIAAEVDGSLRLFQRVSYAGKGPGRQSLAEIFSVRGQVKEIALSGAGTLSGDAADEAIDVLLQNAALVSADASVRGDSLTVTLDNGLTLELGVSGDTLYGCGAWSCPEFFEAFEALM